MRYEQLELDVILLAMTDILTASQELDQDDNEQQQSGGFPGDTPAGNIG